MTTSERTALALNVETTRIDDPGPLIPLLDPQHPMVFMRGGSGIAGIGTAMRIEFSGPDRIEDAAAAWRTIAAAAHVTDPLSKPGTGLVAFGSFSFSERSVLPSVLIVPSVAIGHRDGVSWITRIGVDGAFPARVPTVPWHGSQPVVPLTAGSVSTEDYGRAVESALRRIRRNELSKVVLARDLVGLLPESFDPRPVIAKLALGYPDCWTYACDGLLGSSPETLVRVDHGSVSARVLAGSAARGRNAHLDRQAAAALAASSKDLEEHDYAVQSVLTALQAHSDDVVSDDRPFTLKLPNLWHLASDVSGTLNDLSTSLDLIAALHPTAAVAGTPTETALAVLGELEPFDRGRYAGPIGWVGADGDGEWAIALRCAQITGNTVTAYAGGGIVSDSIAERELDETSMKFQPILEAFGNRPLGSYS